MIQKYSPSQQNQGGGARHPTCQICGMQLIGILQGVCNRCGKLGHKVKNCNIPANQSNKRNTALARVYALRLAWWCYLGSN
jgi:hypothetical protein